MQTNSTSMQVAFVKKLLSKNHLYFTLAVLLFIICANAGVAQTGITRYGTSALANNTTGDYNTAIGYFSMYRNTSGFNNTATGVYSLYNNTTGNHNSAFGKYSLFSTTTGIHNTGYGAFSLYANTTGSSNTAVGFDAVYNNSTGWYNSGFGMYALNKNTTGYYNSASGYAALYTNTTGRYNTAHGYNTLYFNTTGYYNTAKGAFALYHNTTGYGNTAGGYAALYNNTTGSYNKADGYYALYLNTSGSYNTGIGRYALYYNTTGSFNTALGYYASVTTGTLTNATAIGYNARVDASNKVRVGNTSVTSIGGQVGWSTFSDGRFKKDIKNDVQGLAFINSLRPITYTINVKGLNDYYNKGKQPVTDAAATGDDALANTSTDAADAEAARAADAAGRIVHTGFVAQEVEAAAQKLKYDFDGVDKPQTKDGLYGLRYENFVAPLVQAVQELSKQNEDLQKQINDLKAIITSSSQTATTSSLAKLSSVSLGEIVPNPSRGNAIVHYNIPLNVQNAQLAITDNRGTTLKLIKLNAGAGVVNIDASTLSNGTYTCAIMVDGKFIQSKKMVVGH